MDGLLPIPLRARRALATVLLLTAALLTCAGPAAADPAERWPADGPAIQTAMAIAVDQWGFPPCHGDVEIGWWDELDRTLDARATWANDAGAYAAPLSNTSCEIALNPWGQWDWPKLCTVLVHEVGHLDGHDHVDDDQDVMRASYLRPLPACAATPEPAPDVGAPATATATATPTATATATAAKRQKARAKPAHARAKRRAARPHRARPRAPVKRHVARRS